MDPEFLRITVLAARIAQLLALKPPIKESLQGCLDDLLGAVYSLTYALHHRFSSRPQTLSQQDIANVLLRARKMSSSKLRTNGKWTAGFFFNNALFRTAAVYHRSLKIVTGNEDTKKYVDDLEPDAQERYHAIRQAPWVNQRVRKVHGEVNNLKHTSAGILGGRSVQFGDAVGAVGEILDLIETLR